VNLSSLSEFALQVLELLPVRPLGVSVRELAIELRGDIRRRTQRSVHAALREIAGALNVKHLLTENRYDEFARKLPVWCYGVPAEAMPEIREFFKRRKVARAA